MSFVRPSSQITLFLDSFVAPAEVLAPLSVEIKEIDVKSHHHDNKVIVVRVDQVTMHMTKHQLDFIASALATASACSPGSINILRKLDQSRPVVDDPMERVADKLLAGSSFTVGEDA